MSKLPIIGFFIRGVAEINTAILNRDFERVFELLQVYSDCMENKDRKICEESRFKLEQYLRAIQRINGRTHNQTVRLRHSKASEFYFNGGREHKLKIFQTMYNGGYISKEHFRPQTRRDNFFE
jgi:hypothetical protein